MKKILKLALLFLITFQGLAQYSGTGGSVVNITMSNSDKVWYTGNNVIPTGMPGNGIDTAVLLNGDRYDWDGTQWKLVPKPVLDGNDIHILGTIANGPPTSLQVPLPIIGDTAKKRLTNGTIEYWSYNGSAWVLDYSVVPTVIPPTTNVLNKPTVNTLQTIVNGVPSVVQPIIATNTITSPSVGNIVTTVNGVASNPFNILTGNFDNDLGIGADGKVETGFPLHRDTFTGGAFYREWSNNRTGVTGAGAGLVYGINNYGLGSGYWDKSKIGQGSATFGYYNTVTAPYSFATGQQNTVTGSHGFATGVYNTVTNLYSQTSGYSNTNKGYISNITGGNSNQIQAGNYHHIGGGYNNIITAGDYNAIVEGSGNTVNGSYNIIGNGSGNSALGTYNVIGGGISQAISGNYNGIGAGYANRVNGSFNYAVGYNNNLSAASFGNAVSGYSNVVSGDRGVIGGNSNTYAGAYSAMFGNSNTIAAGVYGTLVSGSSNTVNGGWNSSILGDGNNVQAGSLYTKSVQGYYNTIHANTHVVYALGQQNTIGGVGLLTNVASGAIGYLNKVQGGGSHTIGSVNTIIGDNSIGIGYGINSTRTGVITIKASSNRINITSVPAYANVAAANADATLILGDLYTITQGGGKHLMIK